MKQRYEVCKFPALHGAPWKFNSRPLALIAGFVRSCFGLRMSEILVIDTQENECVKAW
jgi:hypothetical protein